MTKKILDFDISDHIDFDLIGIISASKDYRLCFEINQLVTFDFKKSPDIELHLERKGSSCLFALYQHINSDEEQYYLIANKGIHAWFIPEQKHIDYFIMIRNRSPFTEIKEISEQLKTVKLISSVIEMDAADLKSAEHFLYIEPENCN